MDTTTAFVPQEVCALRLGLPLAWFKREVEAGRIPFVMAGRRRMFAIDVVRRSLAEATPSKATVTA